MCGENSSGAPDGCLVCGSPPRVRGKPCSSFSAHISLGITPACAGKTFDFFLCAFCAEDHPRVCGENYGEDYFIGLGQGSPPRVRGKQEYEREAKSIYRITPACAGKTEALEPLKGRYEDHPRVCGEN